MSKRRGLRGQRIVTHIIIEMSRQFTLSCGSHRSWSKRLDCWLHAETVIASSSWQGAVIQSQAVTGLDAGWLLSAKARVRGRVQVGWAASWGVLVDARCWSGARTVRDDLSRSPPVFMACCTRWDRLQTTLRPIVACGLLDGVLERIQFDTSILVRAWRPKIIYHGCGPPQLIPVAVGCRRQREGIFAFTKYHIPTYKDFLGVQVLNLPTLLSKGYPIKRHLRLLDPNLSFSLGLLRA